MSPKPSPPSSPKKQRKKRNPSTKNCSVCELSFFPEEIREGRYLSSLSMCMRCFLKQKEQEGVFKLPSCFGEYDGRQAACSEHCKAAQGCIIQKIEKRAKEWELDFELGIGKPGGVAIQKTALLKALRTFARPMHLIELALCLEIITDRSWTRLKHGRLWRMQIIKRLQQTTQVLDLGDGFFVWSEIWDVEAAGGESTVVLKEPRTALKSVGEILRNISEDEEEKK